MTAHDARPSVAALLEELVGLGDGGGPVAAELVGDAGDEGERGDELVVVGSAEQLAQRHTGADDLSPDGVDEGAVAGPEDGVLDERLGFGPVADGVVDGGRAGAEPGDLGEDEPHPVRPLAAAVDLGERVVEVTAVAVVEPLQVSVGHHRRAYERRTCGSPCLRSSGSLPRAVGRGGT